jgi:hypothetical protein
LGSSSASQWVGKHCSFPTKKPKIRVAVGGAILMFFCDIFPKHREGNHFKEPDGSALRVL